MQIARTTVDDARNPLGITTDPPCLSWQLSSPDSGGSAQTAYRVLVATDPCLLSPGTADVWDSGRVTSSDSVHVAYDGPEPASRTRYHWTVCAWDENDVPTSWAEPGWWETGIDSWQAQWITHDAPVTDGITPQLRHAFTARPKVARARLYATALGVYTAEINGVRVGADLFAPGWTDYRTRVQYETYDVTDLLRDGDNALGATVSPGWYAGHICWFGQRHYGERPALLAQLEILYEDGSAQRVVTDDSWHSATGAVTYADLLMGETYDARLETEGWSEPGFDEAGWSPVTVRKDVTTALVPQADPPVRVTQELLPVAVTEPEPGVFVYDLGQNMVGAVRLKVRGEAGRTVTLRHAEVLTPGGTIYTGNLRSAKATDTYTLRGTGEVEVYEPRFTFHGFRYVELTGYPGTPGPESVTGRVMHTDAPLTMSFETNVPMLNQLHSNVVWGQRGNFLSIPTDTPARDERLGWSGDINVFCGTASYTMESGRFLTKWLTDLRDAQTPDGGFTDVAPTVGDLGHGSAAWGDAGVTVPWTLYRRYGDRRILDHSYPSMTSWIAYLEEHSEGYIRPAEGFGDWLNIDDETRKDLVATAWFVHACDVVADSARALGRSADARRYDTLAGRVREAFRAAYVKPDGLLCDETQTAYVLALSMDLLPEQHRARAADRIVELIEARDWHLSTGFVGAARLLPVLTNAGRLDVAYRLLHQDTFPSWGYPIALGSTTMWERWDSLRPDGTFQDEAMNSFNHYAYGCVGEWMYQNIAGIVPLEPGFRRVLIRPRPGGEVTSCAATYDSVRGPFTSNWSLSSPGKFTLEVTIPPNTTGEVLLPGADSPVTVSPGTHHFTSDQ